MHLLPATENPSKISIHDHESNFRAGEMERERNISRGRQRRGRRDLGGREVEQGYRVLAGERHDELTRAWERTPFLLADAAPARSPSAVGGDYYSGRNAYK
jgi:hypothetical protein